MGPVRGVRREDGFDDLASGIFGSVEGADDALRAAEDALVYSPSLEVYEAIGETPCGILRAIKTEQLPAIPAVVVYFTEADGNVCLRGIAIAVPSDEDV